MAEYGSMFIVSALAAILFFGGWHGPVPVTTIIQNMAVHSMGLELGGTVPFWHFLANLLGCANLIFKATVGVTVMIWVRWTLPRLRIDQVITTCWKYCVPLSAFMFVGVLCWQTWWGLPSPNQEIRGKIREGWVQHDELAPSGEVRADGSAAENQISYQANTRNFEGSN